MEERGPSSGAQLAHAVVIGNQQDVGGAVRE